MGKKRFWKDKEDYQHLSTILTRNVYTEISKVLEKEGKPLHIWTREKGLSSNKVWSIVNGKYLPTTFTLYEIAEACKIDIKVLFNGVSNET